MKNTMIHPDKHVSHIRLYKARVSGKGAFALQSNQMSWVDKEQEVEGMCLQLIGQRCSTVTCQ